MGRYSIREATIVDQLDRLEKDMQSMKSLQYVGNRVVTPKLSEPTAKILSEDGYPPTYTPGDPPEYQVVGATVTFRAETQLNPHGRIIIENFDLLGNQYSINGRADGDPGVSDIYFVPTYVDDGILQWKVIVTEFVNPTTRFYTRFRVAATDSGIVTTSGYADE